MIYLFYRIWNQSTIYYSKNRYSYLQLKKKKNILGQSSVIRGHETVVWGDWNNKKNELDLCVLDISILSNQPPQKIFLRMVRKYFSPTYLSHNWQYCYLCYLCMHSRWQYIRSLIWSNMMHNYMYLIGFKNLKVSVYLLNIHSYKIC